MAACRNAMRHLQMIPGSAATDDGVTLYRRLHAVTSPATGIFEPATDIGELVGKGALLGRITDYFGVPIAELRAPLRGIVLMLNHTPPITAGETPVTLGEWVAGED